MTKKSIDIVFTIALRTAIGKYNGMWSKYQAHDLGGAVIKDILIKSIYFINSLHKDLKTSFQKIKYG